MAFAMSTGRPQRRTGYCCSKKRSPEGFSSHRACMRSVTMCPGQMALTRMPSGPNSIAIWRVIPITADFPAS